jgi:transmembrane sensor
MQRTDDSDDMVLSEEEVQLRKEAVAWVIRVQNDGLSPEDRRAFEVWQAQTPQHARMYRKVSRVWESSELSAAAAVVAGSWPSWLNAKGALPLRWSVVPVACFALVVVLAYHFDVATRWQSDYRTESGERRTVELPDRSMATLNTQSAIALSFDGTVRRIRLLKGEVFFNVRHDSEREFIVESAGTAVRAVGTAFVVRAKSSREHITVLEGTVEVDSKDETASPVAVTAGSQIQMENGRVGPAYPVNVPTASAWLQGRLVVNGVPFASVLDELRRYHPGMIILWNQAVAETNVTGTYHVDDPVVALKLLAKTVPISMIGLTDRLILLF